MARVQMYTTAWCGYCVRAKALLEGKGIEYEEINLDDDLHFRQKLLELTGGWTVPQILVDGNPIGGFTEALRPHKNGRVGRKPAPFLVRAGRPGGNQVPAPPPPPSPHVCPPPRHGLP